MASGKLVGVVSWGYGCADSSYPGGKVNFEYRIQSFNLVRRHITVPANSRHFASAFILLVYARVASDAYTKFIIPHITKWSNPTTRPSNSWVKRLTSTTSEFKLGCTDKGGFYDSRPLPSFTTLSTSQSQNQLDIQTIMMVQQIMTIG